jgi:hypothetical protein
LIVALIHIATKSHAIASEVARSRQHNCPT